ncbi:hypothetical protein GGR77_001440 [Xanthomonas translucens]
MIEQPRRCRRCHAIAASACVHATALRDARMVGNGRVQQRIAKRVRGIGEQRGNVRTEGNRFFTAFTRSPSAAWRFSASSTASRP